MTTRHLLPALCGTLALPLPTTANTSPPPPPPPSQPNIILILADDIGYADLGPYGATHVQTPNVDRLATHGVRCTNAYATASICTPSRYSILTGQYAFRRRDTGIARGDAHTIIKPHQPTLPKTLQTAGYATAAIGKWHLGIGDEKSQDWNGHLTPGPRQLGFDYSFIMAATGDRVPCVFVENQRVLNLDPTDPIQVSYTTPFPGEPLGKNRPDLLTLQPSHGHNQAIINGISRIGYMRGGKTALWNDETIADTLTAKAISFIDQNQSTPPTPPKPFFLYFGTNDIHVPRVPHPRFRGKTGMGPRGDAIAQFDWSVGQIITALERHHILDNTLIILTSDNGHVLDDGYQDQAAQLLGDHRPGGPLRGGKYSIFEAGTRIPFILHWPAHLQPRTTTALISQVDLFATLAALTRQPLPDNAAPDSLDQTPAWFGPNPNAKGRPYIIEQSTGTLSIVQDNWKYIQPSKAPPYQKVTDTELGNLPQPQLYDLSTDPGERNNIATQHPEKTQTLAARLATIKTTPKTR